MAAHTNRRRVRPVLESLDERIVPTIGLGTMHSATAVSWTLPGLAVVKIVAPTYIFPPGINFPKNINSQDTLPKNSQLNRLGGDLAKLYQAFQAGKDTSSFGSYLRIVGGSVAVDVRPSGSLTTLTADLRSMGMNIERIDARTQTVEGLIPIAQLGTLASAASASSITPVYRPVIAGSGFGLALAGRFVR